MLLPGNSPSAQNLVSLEQIIDKAESKEESFFGALNGSDLTIFKVIGSQDKRTEGERYTRIRVEKIEFQDESATAVYFEDVTQAVKMMHLESQLIQKKNEAINLESYTSMMSHEFRTPLATALMFIDLVLSLLTNAKAIKLIILVKNSLNLLLSLVNDIVDLKLIKANQFSTNLKDFCPTEAI